MKTITNILGVTMVLFSIIVFPCSAFSHTDDFIIINGRIKDSKSNANVNFATIVLAGTNISTVTNSDGEFTLKIIKSNDPKELIFSHSGYKTKVLSLPTIPESEIIVFLEQQSIDLMEITVKPLDPQDIVDMAIKKIPNNFSSNPMMLTGFYRETIKQRRNYISISEAILDIYKTAYTSNSGQDRIKIFRARQGVNTKKADTLGVKLQGVPNISLMLDIAKSPFILFYDLRFELYEFRLARTVTTNNRTIYEIEFTQRKEIIDPLYQGKIYIDAENYAITHAEFNLNLTSKEKAARLFVKRKPIGVRFLPTSTSYIVNFVELDGKYYLGYARNELNFKAIWKRRLFNTRYGIVAELAITDRDGKNITKFSKSESFRDTEFLAESAAAFNDKEFWGEHNTIRPEESIEKAIEKYGRLLKRHNEK